jgi:hypothetical protein
MTFFTSPEFVDAVQTIVLGVIAFFLRKRNKED